MEGFKFKLGYSKLRQIDPRIERWGSTLRVLVLTTGSLVLHCTTIVHSTSVTYRSIDDLRLPTSSLYFVYIVAGQRGSGQQSVCT